MTATLPRKLAAAVSGALLSLMLGPAQIVQAAIPPATIPPAGQADITTWNVGADPTIVGLNPHETVDDVSGLSTHVGAPAMVTGMENTRGGFCGLLYWNPNTNTFKTYGVTGGFQFTVELNRGRPATFPVTLGGGDVWATVNGNPSFSPYMNFRGSNDFRRWSIGGFAATGIRVNAANGKVYLGDFTGGLFELDSLTNVVAGGLVGQPVKRWPTGSRPYNLVIDASGNVFATGVSGGGQPDQIIRINPLTNAITRWNVPGGGFQQFVGFGIPNGIATDQEGNVWFDLSVKNTVARLNPTTNVIDQFTKPGISDPQAIASSGAGATLQAFFTEAGGAGAISLLTVKDATPTSATVAPITSIVLPASSVAPGVDFTVTPVTATIRPSVFRSTGVDPSGILRFPIPPGTREPTGMTRVAAANTVFGSMEGSNHVFQLTSGSVVAPPPGRQATRLAFTADSATTSDFNDPTKVAARLTDSSGNPVPGKMVTFTLTPGGPSGTPSCTGTTDATGTARCVITPNQKAGSDTLTATFAGDSSFEASSTSTRFAVTLEETALTYTGPVLFANGSSATLSGNLREDGVTPIFKQPGGAGTPRTLGFTLGSGTSAQSCSGMTDATGTASCTITVNQPLGPTTVRADFASDGFYRSATDSRAALVFAFLGGFPGNGTSFVIGDRNAVVGNSVTFWGAQWAKDNSLSGGAAPRAFKVSPTTPALRPRSAEAPGPRIQVIARIRRTASPPSWR